MVRIFIVPHFHYDTIYSKEYEEYLKISFKNILNVISILKKHPSYRFLIEQTVLLEEFWKRFPEYRTDIRKFIEEDRIEIAPGMFVMPDMNLISGESLIRQIERGKKFLKKFGRLPKVCWIADCWGHHRQLPQILKKSGYTAYVFSRAMRQDIKPYIHFIWEGIDGSKIPSYWIAIGYDGLIFNESEGIEAGLSNLEEKLELMKNYSAVDLILLPDGADFASPREITLDIVKRWNVKNRKEKAKISTPTEYFKNLEGKKLPVLSVDFNPQYSGTYTSRIEIKQFNRKLENRIYLLEILNTLASFENFSFKEYEGKLDEIIYILLFNQFHDIICGSILDTGYYEVMEKYKTAERISEDIFEKFLSGLTQEDKNSIAIWNSCSFPRKEVAIVELKTPEGMEVEIYDRKKKINSQVVERKDEKAKILFEINLSEFQRKNLKFTFVPSPSDSSIQPPFKFKNPFYTAEISGNGLISSLLLKNRKEIVDKKRPFFGELIFQIDNGDFWVYYERPVPGGKRFAMNISDPYPENVTLSRLPIFARNFHEKIEVKKGKVADMVKIYGRIKYWEIEWKFEHIYFLYKNFPFIDFQTIFYPEGKNYRLRVVFPTSIKNGTIKREIPFGYEFQDEGEYPSFNWTEYRDEEKGICLINQGLPGNNVTDGVMMLSLFRAVDMGPNKAKSITGYGENRKYTFNYRILPFLPEDKNYKPYLSGISFNQPFLLLFTSKVFISNGLNLSKHSPPCPALLVTFLCRSVS